MKYTTLFFQHRFTVSALLILLLSQLLTPAGQAHPDLQDFSTPLPAGKIIFSDQASSASSPAWSLSLRTPAFEIITRQDEIGPCQEIQVEGFSQSGQPGAPALPTKGGLLGLPLDTEVMLQVQPAQAVLLPGRFRLCPVSQPLVQFDPFTGMMNYNGEERSPAAQYYATDRFLPEQIARLGEIGFIRSQRVAQVFFQPFQYNPVSGQLRYYPQITADLSFTAPQALKKISPRPINEGSFEPLLRQSLLNYEMARSWRQRVQAPGPLMLREEKAPFDSSTAILSPQGIPTRFKFLVSQEGIYKATYEDLVAAGADFSGVDPHTFQLLNQNVEVAIQVIGEADASFDPGDYLLFYGQGIHSRYTRQNVYFLHWGLTEGRRMEIADGTVSGAGIVPNAFRTTAHYEGNTRYLTNYPSGPDQDVWYWDVIYASGSPVTKSFNFSVNNLPGGSHTARLRGLLRSYAGSPQHHTRIYINNNLVHDVFWPEGSQLLFEADFPQSYLAEGNNTIKLEAPLDGGITLDVVLINWFELDYWDGYTAEGNRLFFNGVPASLLELRVAGFSDNLIDVFDITDPTRPLQIVNGSVSGAPGNFTLAFDQQITAQHDYLALTPSARLTPDSILPDYPSHWKSPANGARYIIISHPDFLEAIAPLAAFRQAQGLQTVLVDVTDVYDEFNYGVISPQAIHDFLAYAYQYWDPAPELVLLVGDGNYDPLNYWGTNQPSFIPPFLAQVDPWMGETAAENLFVTVSGADIFPDLHLGRLPVASSAQTTAIVNKILAYENPAAGAEWNRQILFVADNPDGGGNFNVYSHAIAENNTPATYLKDKVHFGENYTDVNQARLAVLTAINQGRLLVNYIGHGNNQFWASERLLSTNSLSSLTNAGKYPFLAPMTCLEGSFHVPPIGTNSMISLAEAMLRAENSGSIGSFSPTGFGVASGHDYLNRGLFDAFLRDYVLQFGPATTAAKLNLYSQTSDHNDLIQTYMLFGDPAASLQVMRWSYLPLLPNELFELR